MYVYPDKAKLKINTIGQSHPPFINWPILFSTAPLKALPDQTLMRYM